MSEDEQRPQYLVAADLADRLRPGRKMSELLLWIPNVFAYTSYVLSLTGAYQLVVSPPRGKKWFPLREEIKLWLGTKAAKENLTFWLTEVAKGWRIQSAFNDDKIKKRIDTLINGDRGGRYGQIGISATLKYLGRTKRIEKKIRGKSVKRIVHRDWTDLVTKLAQEWWELIKDIKDTEFDLIKNEDNRLPTEEESLKLLETILNRTPPSVLACWAYFYKKTYLDPYPIVGHEQHIGQASGPRLPISKLLCNDDGVADVEVNILWPIAQTLLTLHAVADEACVQWGVNRVKTDRATGKATKPTDGDNAQFLAERLLLRTGSLSTIHTDRCRVFPKRHNPSLGITLRSLSSNLAFHRSPIEVVWRNSSNNNPLAKKLKLEDSSGTAPITPNKQEEKIKVTMLLLPLPLNARTKDFGETDIFDQRVNMIDKHRFFRYRPEDNNVTPQKIVDLIEQAYRELDGESIDIIVLPESAMKEKKVTGRRGLEAALSKLPYPPSVYVIGVREEDSPEKAEQGTVKKFPRNVVYCKYFDKKTKYATTTLNTRPKERFKQYKHHRWRLDKSQIKQYGLSHVLDPDTIYWEAIKVPRRRVSFLNVGQRMTLCHLICEDLARQDPIADLIRHAGPSLVVAILLDGPQKADRWSSRYASVLSEDPGSSVIALTSLGMARRWSSPYKSMSRVVALWSDRGTPCREIELEQGAEAILLNLEVFSEREVTADGREESEEHETSVFKLVDVIQIYPS